MLICIWCHNIKINAVTLLRFTTCHFIGVWDSLYTFTEINFAQYNYTKRIFQEVYAESVYQIWKHFIQGKQKYKSLVYLICISSHTLKLILLKIPSYLRKHINFVDSAIVSWVISQLGWMPLTQKPIDFFELYVILNINVCVYFLIFLECIRSL